jgi:thiol:disulfide interchange protein
MRPDSARSTRGRPTVLLTLAAGLLIARIAIGAYDAHHPPPVGGLVHWRAPDAAEAAAATEGRPILYDFSAAWCQPCQQMEREVFADAEAADFINKTYVPVRVADEDQAAISTALRLRHRVEGLPTLLVVRAGDVRPFRIEGYDGKRRTVAFLKRAAEPRQPMMPGLDPFR